MREPVFMLSKEERARLVPCRVCGADPSAPLGEWCPGTDPDNPSLHVFWPDSDLDGRLAVLREHAELVGDLVRQAVEDAADDQMEKAEYFDLSYGDDSLDAGLGDDLVVVLAGIGQRLNQLPTVFQQMGQVHRLQVGGFTTPVCYPTDPNDPPVLVINR